ncbi:phosphocholine cytidylyltransferase family protein [Clostridiales bacterium FE2010]|nr:phosphocholine cytidylyltransferase family protein [Clostridiales bacterium FE2010]
MALSRIQFDILETMARERKPFSSTEMISTSHSEKEIADALRELDEKGYVSNGAITNSGISALEPYKVKRAIFLAAGFGTRMIPITFNTPKPLVRVHGIRIIDRLIDACLAADIQDIYIVRGYLGETFDQLLYKYPMIKFIENPMYNEANNISSALVARYLIPNAYVLEADMLLSNPAVIKKYHYTSNYLGIKKPFSDDWVVRAKNGIIYEETVSAEGDDVYQMVGFSYWDEKDGYRLIQDIQDVFQSPGGKDRYWEQVPLVFRKDHYQVEVRECKEEDIVEIDTFNELKTIDKTYDV